MSYVRVWAQDREFDVDVAIQDLRAAAEAAGFLVVDREEAEKMRQDRECWTCDGTGEVVHDIDCDGCARGEDHSEPCPVCDGRGETTMVPLVDLVPAGEAP